MEVTDFPWSRKLDALERAGFWKPFTPAEQCSTGMRALLKLNEIRVLAWLLMRHPAEHLHLVGSLAESVKEYRALESRLSVEYLEGLYAVTGSSSSHSSQHSPIAL